MPDDTGRQTITGVLHVIHQPKRRGGTLFEQLVYGRLEDAGKLERLYWPPIYYVLGERTCDRRPKWHYQYRFRGRPAALDPDLRGHTITVRSGIEPFGNGLGAMLDRPHIVEVGDYVECPYHDDPYTDPDRGSARVHCISREEWCRRVQVREDDRSARQVVADTLEEVEQRVNTVLGSRGAAGV